MRRKLNVKNSYLYIIEDASSVALPKDLEGRDKFPCIVPGNIETTVAEKEGITDLYFGTNVLALCKYELCDFWYEIVFENDEEFDFITFDGVDVLAEYFLGGKNIGSSDNMFIPHSFDVSDCLKKGENTLFVHIKNPISFASEKEYGAGLWSISDYNYESVYVRKAPHEYGWDICPRAMLGGIFKDVFLEKRRSAEIESVYFHTLSIDHLGAHVKVIYDLKLSPALYGKTRIVIKGEHGNKSFSLDKTVVFKHGVIDFCIPHSNLVLWNPVGYGNPYLYDVNVELRCETGDLLAESKLKVGVRTLTLDFDKSGNRKEFLFKANGIPVMVKGTNWVPLDALHSNDKNRLYPALKLLKQTGCNMVRCWGGNLYESEEFFDFCDENGIMVWQDFSMACSVYPNDEEFVKNLKKEISTVVRRIRTHPSLCCYCGDNENDLGMFFNGINVTDYGISRRVIPETLFDVDPFRPYLPSSPYFTEKILSSREENDLAENHLWGPRNYFKSKFYLENKNVFISEIGYHGCPSETSIRKFISEEFVCSRENDEWMLHQTSPDGKWSEDWNRIKLMAFQVRELFGEIPEDTAEFPLLSQISQAEAIKFFIEFTRVNKWRKTGIIWWNLIDCWPQFSDAVVDYYYEKKLAFHYIVNSQKPLCLIIAEANGWTSNVVLANDGGRNFSGEYRIIDGLTESTIGAGKFVSRANENAVLCEVDVSKNIEKYFILLAETDEGEVFVNHYVNIGGALNKENYRKFLKNFSRYCADIKL